MSVASFKARAGQRAFMRDTDEHRICGFVTRRQYGKTTFAGDLSLRNMIRTPGHTVVFGSVKLDLGREIVRKEAASVQNSFAHIANVATDAKLKLELFDAEKAKRVPTLSADDFAELYEAQRLEFRLYHSASVYSRTKVVALTPEAVGETGDLILDEVGRVKQFRAVWEAVKPIIASNPQFRCVLTTTPPPDDSHYSFELLSPPVGAVFEPRPEGHLYRSDLGVWIRRVTAFDAHADGVNLYDDDTGAVISPEESRRREYDKEAWDRNYGCIFVIGGTSACGLLQLNTAQQRGIGQCQFFNVTDDLEFATALRWLTEHLGPGAVGIGADLATTTKATSNPSSVAIVERSGAEFIVRAVINWKTADPAVATERYRQIVGAVSNRAVGGPARRFCLDATSERFFAQALRRDLAALIPVELVIASETIERPGEPEPITMKQYLGGLLVGELDDNHLWLPPERFLREDWRLVKKEKGAFVCEPDVDGKHGDTFDATKLAIQALVQNFGGLTSTKGIFYDKQPVTA
jgi:hypothetical protein